MATNADAAGQPPAGLDERDVRALTEYFTVLNDVGRVRGADQLYLVVSESGSEYLVDRRTGRCGCPDAEHRDPDGGCKHVRRVAFATGAQPVPDGPSGIDPQLGAHVEPADTGEEERRPTRHELADFGDGESTGVQKL